MSQETIDDRQMRLTELYHNASNPTAEEIEEFEQEARAAREDIVSTCHLFLQKCGFTYTCKNPASLWLYERKLPDGRTVLVDKGTAFRIASALADNN